MSDDYSTSAQPPVPPDNRDGGGINGPASSQSDQTAMTSYSQPAKDIAAQTPAPLAAFSPDTSGLPAEDIDLIEREWVDKAKAIVDQTRDNPYLQNKELSKVKAQYIQKRYNKQLKLKSE
jgi:hypothetical protein